MKICGDAVVQAQRAGMICCGLPRQKKGVEDVESIGDILILLGGSNSYWWKNTKSVILQNQYNIFAHE